MADVYLAVSRGPAGFNKLLVLKQLPPSRCADTDLLTMFLDEASLAARLNHPNVVQVNEVGHDGDKYFIAMEYLEGQPLVRILRRLQPDGLSTPVLLRIVADACAGLHYVHTLTDFDGTPLGTVHRDVSPHNLFITYAGHVKLVDFGIAKTAGRATETQIGMLKGKITYMSPEQIHGSDVDARADIFSLGIVLYELVTRERMWGSQPQEVEILRKLVNGEIPTSPRARFPDVPEDVDRICQRALALDREERYASALEMQDDLEQAIARLPQRASERDIGDLVARMFAEERLTIAAVVERQIRELRSNPSGTASSNVLPTLGVDGMISVTPSRLRALPRSDASQHGPDPSPSTRRRTALLGASVFALLLAIVLLVSFKSTRREQPAPVATVQALRPPAGTPHPANGTTTANRAAAEGPVFAADTQADAGNTPATAPLAAPKPSPGASARAKAAASVKSRARKHTEGGAQRASAEPARPVITIPAVSTFGPLDGRK
jgi:serine/threonine-protein kinase